MLLGPVQVVGWQHTVCAEDVPAVTTALDRLRSGAQEAWCGSGRAARRAFCGPRIRGIPGRWKLRPHCEFPCSWLTVRVGSGASSSGSPRWCHVARWPSIPGGAAAGSPVDAGEAAIWLGVRDAEDELEDMLEALGEGSVELPAGDGPEYYAVFIAGAASEALARAVLAGSIERVTDHGYVTRAPMAAAALRAHIAGTPVIAVVAGSEYQYRFWESIYVWQQEDPHTYHRDGDGGVKITDERLPAAMRSVLAGVAHGELLSLAPFGVADGVVARAVSRLITMSSGLDPHGLGVRRIGNEPSCDEEGEPEQPAPHHPSNRSLHSSFSRSLVDSNQRALNLDLSRGGHARRGAADDLDGFNGVILVQDDLGQL